MVGPDEYGSIFVSGLTHSLGHLFLRLDLHVHITRAGFDRPDQALLRHLHCLDLTAQRGQFRLLQRRFAGSQLADTAGSNQRNVRSEKFLCLPGSQRTSVQTDLCHLTMFQSFVDLL